MQLEKQSAILVENASITSILLDREVKVDLYMPAQVTDSSQLSLLLINDGQNMEEMGFASILEKLYTENALEPLLCVAIHAGQDRRKEYGVAGHPDYLGRGNKAGLYSSFIFEELIPFLRNTCSVSTFREKAFAGFSLGALSALDIVWNHPAEFSKVGVFSGSLWWRSVAQEDEEYDDDKHRIMQQVIRNGQYAPWLKFYFQCGNMDETKDRNDNGIIDSIEDTLDMVKELENKSYITGESIKYVEMPDGRHDIPSWGKAMPDFLKWGWGGVSSQQSSVGSLFP
jgi:enterochelin esterase-like enzyme